MSKIFKLKPDASLVEPRAVPAPLKEVALPPRLKPARQSRTTTVPLDSAGVPKVAATETFGSVKLTPGQAYCARVLLENRVPVSEAEAFCRQRWHGRLMGGELKAVLQGHAAVMAVRNTLQ